MKVRSDIEISGIWQAEPCPERLGDGFSECSVVQSGGHAILVKARRQGRWWMLKGLDEKYRDKPFYIELFEKEVALTTSLRHPGIVQAFDVEVVEPYGRCLVMEYLDGSTLDTFLGTKPAMKTRKALAMQLLDVMEYIHSMQTVHRDLKPTNILVTHNGKYLKLIDFGLADSDAYYIFKQPSGTEGYMAPEQRTSRIADVRNDIYSIGVVLQQMKLGWLSSIAIRKCLYSADRRYANIAELRKGLQRTKAVFMAVCVLAVIIPLSLAAQRILTANREYISTIEQFRDSIAKISLIDKETVAQLQDTLHTVTQHAQQLFDKEGARNQHEQDKQAFITEKDKEIAVEIKKLENPDHPIWHGKEDYGVAVLKIDTMMNRWIAERKDLNDEERAAIYAHFRTTLEHFIPTLNEKWYQYLRKSYSL